MYNPPWWYRFNIRTVAKVFNWVSKRLISVLVKRTYIEEFGPKYEKNVSAYDMVEIPQTCKSRCHMVKEKLEFFAKGWKELV